MSQTIKYKNGFRIINNIPDLTEDELINRKKEILLKLYTLFFNNNNMD